MAWARRGMRQDAAAPDEQVEASHVYERFARPRVQGFANLPRPLDAPQARGQLQVLLEREREGAPRKGVLHHQLGDRLWDGRGADHLVLHAVLQVALVEGDRHPAQHALGAGLREDVGDAVTHAQVGAHRARELAVEDAETSVVAPPMSTPTRLMPRRAAMVRMMRPTAAGVGMMGAPVHSISLS